ncbi:MAG: hypothetical protein PHR55_03555, partial [Bacilli bacterium]|nr:hypothetical protein [Bacilli bacterium]
METFFRFLFEMLTTFFSGLVHVVKAIIASFGMTFNFKSYSSIVSFYKKDFSGMEWVFVGLAILIMVIIVAGIIFLLLILVKKYIRLRKTLVEQETLLEELAELNNQVVNLMKEKEDILAMKVSQLGLKPNESSTIEENKDEENKEGEEELSDENIRFSKLHSIDKQYINYKVEDYGNAFTLVELVDMFRNFAAGQLGLFYKEEMIRLFISALASTKLIILQGISGTGKTSLAYAWGKFLSNDSCVASVQPSWRDRTEVF